MPALEVFTPMEGGKSQPSGLCTEARHVADVGLTVLYEPAPEVPVVE